MKQLRIFLLLMGAIISVSDMAQSKPAIKNTPVRRTVRDYYLLLPRQYFTESPRENLRLRPMVTDIANDYLETSGEAGQPYLQTALFRYRGTEIFAVNALFEMGYSVKFYRLRNGKLRDVTRQVWSIKLRSHDRLYLPRRGTTITIMDETFPGDEKTRLTVLWRNGRFVKSQ